jgi:hypothetical protein
MPLTLSNLYMFHLLAVLRSVPDLILIVIHVSQSILHVCSLHAIRQCPRLHMPSLVSITSYLVIPTCHILSVCSRATRFFADNLSQSLLSSPTNRLRKSCRTVFNSQGLYAFTTAYSSFLHPSVADTRPFPSHIGSAPRYRHRSILRMLCSRAVRSPDLQ